MPRVSIVIPAHNAARFVGRAIESVREQTYSDWEIVVVDDGSSDDTWELLQASGPRVHSFRREHAGGPAVARNLALEHAGGELVAFLDADDLLLPRYLESQLAYFDVASESRGASESWGASNSPAANGSRGASKSRVASDSQPGAVGLVTCDARILIDERYAPYTHLQTVPGRYAPITLERELRLNVIYGACLVPSAVGAAVGWFDAELFGTEDYGLWIKILEAGYRAVLNEEVLAVYRRTAGSVSSNIASQGLNNRRAYALALDRGSLTARQRRIARRAIRYNRAMEEVALLRFSGARRGSSALRRLHRLPSLLWVALTNPRMWPEWLQLLRTGQAKDAAELRAHR
ncbi:MAG TPA: glycosyltransferase family 2 protein [Solirubrobacteraceae bacterium]|jgi:glycosyltransferase involved in cell wall biosynthesis|nr:glycosyltransferase family 2 protein [Solirubrobacteraceae bacterium]